MKHIPKKLLTVLLAGTMAVNAAAFSGTLTSSADDVTKYEFEDGTYTGTLTAADAASGGYYIFFDTTGQEATVTIPVETAGAYDVVIGYNAQYGTKTENLVVNGTTQGTFECASTGASEIAEVTIGSVRLSAGDNEIGVSCNWSWVNVDYVYIEETVLPEVTASDTSCCDSDATEGTQKLMEFLSSVYGEYVISGQQEYYGTSRDDEFDYIEELTGELPVIRGFDFGNNCPLYAWDDGVTDRIINWVNEEGGIATASWHLNVPVSMDSYTLGSTMSFENTTYSEDTDFVTANVMIEGTTEYEYFLLAVDNLAEQLLELQDAGVSLLFRPFHEAEGNGGADGSGAWFWWSKEGAEVYVELYQYLYELLTEQYGIHNLIWEFNSYTYSDVSAEFYPGRDYVDIIGYDKYNATDWSTGTTSPNESAISSTFYSLISMYDNTKMIAMMENDTIPSVENMTEEGAYWLYFMPWYGEHLMDSNYNDPDTLTTIYQSDLVLTLSEFKEMYSNFTASGTTVTWDTQTTTTKATTETTTLPDIEGAEFATVKSSSGIYTITFDEAMGDTIYLILEADDSVTYANGCVGVSVELDGTYYWVSFNMEMNMSGDTVVSLTTDNLYNITYNSGASEVTDESLIAQIVAAAQEESSGQVQIWWANDDSGSSVATSLVTLTAAYILSGDVSTTETAEETTTTEETTTISETETTAETTAEETTTETVTVSETDATEETTETETTTTTTTETTTSTEPEETTTTIDVSALICGDVNSDGNINLADSIRLSKYVAGVVELSDTEIINADVNADDDVDAADALVLLKFQVDLVSSLPYTE